MAEPAYSIDKSPPPASGGSSASLEQRNTELEDMIYRLAHDLKGRTRGIRTLSRSLLQARETDRLNEDEKNKLDRLDSLSKQMGDQIDDLYRLSQIMQTDLAIQDTDMCSIAKDIRRYMPELQKDDIRLSIEEPLPQVLCDQPLVSEALTCLIRNGLQYNESDEKIIEIGHTGEAFFLRDNGIGIEPKDHDEIFRLFRRLHKPGTYGNGSGIGLTITQKIIEKHGGRIWLESDADTGTTFYFTLPGAKA